MTNEEAKSIVITKEGAKLTIDPIDDDRFLETSQKWVKSAEEYTQALEIKMVSSFVKAKEYWLNHELVDDKEQSESVWCAILALEKQIPKKPNKFKNIYPNEQYICPACDYCVGYKCGFTIPSREMYVNPFIKYKYCLKCGQAIDWSESDD